MKYLNGYLVYINELVEAVQENKLFIENGDFESGDIAWDYEIDLTQPWSQFQANQLNHQQFNQQYAQLLAGLNGTECWLEMSPLIEKLKTTIEANQSESLYNQIYDVADKYLIEIKT